MARGSKAAGTAEPVALTAQDMLRLEAPRPKGQAIQRLRDRHHVLARLIASGVAHGKAAAVMGMSVNRVSLLCNDPAFSNLVATYRKDENLMGAVLGPLDAYAELATGNAMMAEQLVRDRLEDAEEADEPTIPMKELLQISRDAADRFGFGKRSTQTNVNIDFVARLDAAVKRSNAVLEAAPVRGTSPGPVPELPPAVATNLLAPALHVIDGTPAPATVVAPPAGPAFDSLPATRPAEHLPVTIERIRRRV